MGSLSNFLGKPKEIELDGIKIMLHPLKVKDMSLFQSEGKSAEEIAKISTDILKLSIPDTTDEEIDGLSLEKFIIIMEEINKLNGFTDKRLDAIKESIKQKKSGR